jgi:hypothetical protein
MRRGPNGRTTVLKGPSVGSRRKLKALEEVAGLLCDLPPEELKAFSEAIKRRPLFKARHQESRPWRGM